MNINRDYLIINDVKKSNIKLDNGSMFFYITDKNTQNIFVNLVINVSNNDLIQKYANIENAEDYTLTMNIVKPDNTYKVVEGKLHDKEKAIFEFNLNEDCCDEIGTYRCELLTKCNINNHEEITTSNKLTYKVKSSVLNDLDDIVEAPEYPLVIQLFDKLSDIDQYEEDRRANELARQLAEEQRQARFNTLDADMVDRVNAMDSKMDDVENRISAKEQAVDKLIVDTKKDIDDYKVAKNTEINEYKTAKDTEINEAIANQNTAINAQNDKISAVENNVVAQNSRLDVLETKATTHEARIAAVEAKDAKQDSRLDVAENRLANIGNDIANTMQPIIDGHTSRLDAIEAINVAQNTRLDAIEVKNQQQDDRLLDIEKVNNRQDIDIKCLYGASQTIDVTKDGNSIYLQNSNNGFAVIDEIKGNTLVNCNKEPDKELILNGNINTSGDNNITLTEGVDGGLVDVALEGNTMVNVCNQKDPVAITKGYTVETGNHVALQGEYDGKCRPVTYGNTLWIDNDTGKVLTAFDETKNLRLQSSFEDKVVTQEMVDNGEELAENLGKYKVDYVVTGKNKFDKSKGVVVGYINKGGGVSTSSTDCKVSYYIPVNPNTVYFTNNPENETLAFYDINKNYIDFNKGKSFTTPSNCYYVRCTIKTPDFENNFQLEQGTEATPYEPYKEYKKTFYLNSPLLEGDTIEQQGDNVVHVHRYGKVVLDGSDDENWFHRTDLSNDTRLAFVSSINNNLVNAKYISDKIPRGNNNIWFGSSTCVLYVDISELSTQDSIGCKQWLQQNPITVVYQLATPQYEVISQNDTILCDSYVNGHLDVDSVVPIEKVMFNETPRMTLKYLYPSTDYIVQFEADNVGSASIVVGGKNIGIKTIAKGINKFNATTNETPNTQLKIGGIGFNASNIVVTEATNQDFGYFEGMKSVGECEDLEVVSSNTDSTLSNTQTLTHEPLRSVGDIKDKYVLIDGKWYIERNCGVRAYQEGDIDNYITDKINTVYPLSTPTYEPIEYNPFEVYSEVTHISNNSTIPCNMTIKNTGYNCLLKPSTTYTVSSNLGLNVVTTPSTLTEDCLRFYDTDTSSKTIMKDVTILEGDYTTGKPLPSHFSGIESAFEQEYDEAVGKYKVKVKVIGKNLFDINKIIKGEKGDGSINKNYSSTDFIEVMPNSIYVVKNYQDFKFDGVYLYDGNKTFLKRLNLTMSTGKIQVPSNIHYIKIQIFNSRWTDFNCDVQLEQGTEATPYESYKENYIEFYINEPLRGIGDIKDRVYVKDDKVVVERNCGQREYQDGDFGTYLTDKVNTVYQLAEPIYEEIEYNDVKLFIEIFKNSTLFYGSNIPVTSKVWYSYSVPLVDTVAQTTNISDQQDSMIIDMATQVAVMEIMLM